MTTTHLRNFVESVAELPSELQRCFRLMRELDEKAHTLQVETDAAARRRLEEAAAAFQGKGGAPDEPPAKRARTSNPRGQAASSSTAISDARLEADIQQVVQYSEEKVNLAQQLYEYVDQRICRLDRDMKAFDTELTRERIKLGLPEVDVSAAASQADGRKDAVRRKNDAGTAADGPGPPPLEAAEPDVAETSTDPLEPVYCYCQRVSFGEMIACDNDNCPIEWFHYECVGIAPEHRPKGKWYCKECAQQQNNQT